MTHDTPDDEWMIPPIYWRWVSHPWFITFVLWVVCFATAGQRLDNARSMFKTPTDPSGATLRWERPTGTTGHKEIDFGGQWLMGRMVVAGHADELYNRNRQWEVAWDGFPIADEPPALRDYSFPTSGRPDGLTGEEARHDAENLMTWLVGDDPPERDEIARVAALPFAANALTCNPYATAVLTVVAHDRLTPEVISSTEKPVLGGPLYPPIHGFFYAPVALAPPAAAYAWFQWFLVGLAFVAGFAARTLSRGVLWWPVATWLILVYPGCRAGLDLGQNPIITVTILLSGWAFVTRGRDGLGGMVWGLLAFKPVWAAAFFVVPLLMRRWRFCGAMLATGAVLGLATMPFTGIEVWFEWLQVGKLGAEGYLTNKNWITLSRDLHGLPRRLLIDFDLYPESDRLDTPGHRISTIFGWQLWGIVFASTALAYLFRGDRRKPTGLGAGLLFLGAWLCCYRFMYYDVLISVVPIIVLLADPARWLRTTAFDVRTSPNQPVFPIDSSPMPAVVAPAPGPAGPSWIGYVNSFALTIIMCLLIGENWLIAPEPQVELAMNGWTWTDTDSNGEEVTRTAKLAVAVSYYQAWDTLLVFMLWVWALARMLWHGDKSSRA